MTGEDSRLRTIRQQLPTVGKINASNIRYFTLVQQGVWITFFGLFMRKKLTALVVLCITFLGVQQSEAIAVDDYAVAETNPAAAGYSLDWDYVYTYRDATAVAVDHYWILTAAHVADDVTSHTKSNLTINGVTYYQQEAIFHPSADLALVRYDKPFPGYYHLYDGDIYHTEGSGRNRTTVYDELIMVGFGYAGTVTASSFTSSGTWGVKRWGTNRGEQTDFEYTMDVGDSSGERTTIYFYVSFELDDTDFEAGGNTFDSGGSYFIEENGEWKVAGINLLRNGTDPFVGNYAAQVSEYTDWITSNIPDYDTDMDGLPDWWELLYGESDAGADPDEDHFSNYAEWIADTDPNLGSSYLQVTSFSNGIDVVFSSSTNRMYQIEQNLHLTNAAWTAATGWISGSNLTTSVNLPAVDGNLFYRVRAKLP
jgi:hypothetical protein